FCGLRPRPPPRPTPFPYTTLFRSLGDRLSSVDDTALPHAADVAKLAAPMFGRGEAIAPEHVEPAYLRNNVALTLAEQASAKKSRSEEHTSELQSRENLVCRLLLEK